MLPSLSRFVKTLCVPSQFVVRFDRVIEGTGKRFHGRCLELYHAPSGGCGQTVSEVSKRIFSEGFRVGSGSKGGGVYLSSHARYAYCWRGSREPIFICDVLFREGAVKRYHAEIPPGYEYVVTDTQLIIPKYLVYYTVSTIGGSDRIEDRTAYTKPGEFGCLKCDIEEVKCDCEQHPTCYPEENILNRTKEDDDVNFF